MYDRIGNGPPGFVNQLLARQMNGRRGKGICLPFTSLQQSDGLQYIASCYSEVMQLVDVQYDPSHTSVTSAAAKAQAAAPSRSTRVASCARPLLSNTTLCVPPLLPLPHLPLILMSL